MLKIWAFGLLGTLGIQYFFVGRLLTGFVRLVYGAAMWIIGVTVSLYAVGSEPDLSLQLLLMFAVFAFVPSFAELVLILMGKFRDAFKNSIS